VTRARLDVALATCRVLPEPDPDAAPLLDALRSAGLEAESLAWDDPDADFGRARLTLLRSTWNYPRNVEAFLAWAERTARASTLVNSLDVVRWNHHKRYLTDLAARAVPTVPTELVPRGAARSLADIVAERGFSGGVVVKPAVSAASLGTLRFGPRELARGEAHLRALVRERDALVQPFLPSVEGYGERALVFIAGEVTHAVRKSPRFAGEAESVSTAVEISEGERALAERAVAAVSEGLLYARIDVAPGPDGAPVVMELELIEPSLFFDACPRALARFVGAVRRLLAR
jgi:glutathione synthase/RimK-type ligase-like ATP-grasp enzyme